jgi:hypothetical protein
MCCAAVLSCAELCCAELCSVCCAVLCRASAALSAVRDGWERRVEARQRHARSPPHTHIPVGRASHLEELVDLCADEVALRVERAHVELVLLRPAPRASLSPLPRPLCGVPRSTHTESE